MSELESLQILAYDFEDAMTMLWRETPKISREYLSEIRRKAANARWQKGKP